jgi:hypothetical protein
MWIDRLQETWKTGSSIRKELMKMITKLLTIAGLAFAFATCASADITWTLNDVTFTDGNSATGFFTTDLGITTINSFSIVVGNANPLDSFTAAIMVNAYLPSEIGIANSDWSKYVDLYLSSPLTSAGGKVNIASGFDCPTCGVLIVHSDTGVTGVVGSTVPEPRFGAVLLIGLAGLGFLARRKFAAVRS